MTIICWLQINCINDCVCVQPSLKRLVAVTEVLTNHKKQYMGDTWQTAHTVWSPAFLVWKTQTILSGWRALDTTVYPLYTGFLLPPTFRTEHHDFKNCNCSHVSGSFLYTGFYGLTENQCRDLKLGPWVKLKVKVSFCCWVTTVRKEQGQGFPPGWMMLFRKEWRTVSLRHPGWVCKRWFGGLGFQNYFGAKSEELVKTTMLQTKLWQGCG